MEEKITKEEIEKLMQVKGECRGAVLKADADFILKEEGEERLKKFEQKMAELGYPMDYKKMKVIDFFPLGVRVVQLLVLQKFFGFDREKFRELGKFQAKTPLFIKLFVRFFVSLEILTKKAPEMWRKHYTIGDFQVQEFNSEKRSGFAVLKNFALHPLVCQVLEGYFVGAVSMIVGDTVICEEVKCTFKGDDYHMFSVKW